MSTAVSSVEPIPGGNRERIGRWADLVYHRRGGVTHVKPHVETAPYPSVLCGRELSWGESWLGTGNQAEYDQARRMPLCVRCAEAARGRNA